MKFNAKVLVGAALLVPLLIVNTVWAQTTSDPGNKPDNTELQRRLEERKSKIKARLTDVEQNVVKLRCKAAQGKIKSVQGRLNGRAAERLPRYNKAIELLSNLSAKLKANDQDTTALDEQIAQLKAKIQTYQNDYSSYKQQIDDLIAMDCESDPEAFKATLQAARDERTQVVRAAQDIRTFMTTQLKPTLLSIREHMNTGNDHNTEGRN